MHRTDKSCTQDRKGETLVVVLRRDDSALKGKDMDNDWDGLSLEEYLEKMVREGYIEIIKPIIGLLSEEKKEKYRKLYLKLRNESKEKGSKE